MHTSGYEGWQLPEGGAGGGGGGAETSQPGPSSSRAWRQGRLNHHNRAFLDLAMTVANIKLPLLVLRRLAKFVHFFT